MSVSAELEEVLPAAVPSSAVYSTSRWVACGEEEEVLVVEELQQEVVLVMETQQQAALRK